MSSTVEQIKDRLDIVDVISGYTQLQRAGSSFKARCPFHSERTPSFSVSPTRQSYHCFGCGVHGDIFTFVQEIEGVDFKGALKILAEQAGVEIVYEKGESKEEKDEKEQLFAAMQSAKEYYVQQYEKNAEAEAYLTKRGLTTDTIERFQVGFAPDDWHGVHNALKAAGHSEVVLEKVGLIIKGDKGYYDRFRSRIMFPMRDTAGRVVAFSGRIFGNAAEDEKNAKYINSPETELYNKSKVLFGFDMAKQTIRKKDFAIFVEGQMDLLAVHQAGFTNAVAISGTALTPEHCTAIGRMSKNVVLALDSDEAGVKAVGRSALIALKHGFDVKVAHLTDGKDPADILLEEGVVGWREAIRGAKHVVEFLLDVYAQRTQQEGGERDERAFKKKVEEVVLPFVASISSRIDQEHFVKIVAGRLGVSESAVFTQLGQVKLPQEARKSEEPNVAQARVADYRPQFNPLSVLVALIAWQEGVKEPALDAAAIKQQVQSLVGEDAYQEAVKEVDEGVLMQTESLYATPESVQAAVAERLEHLRQQQVRSERWKLMRHLNQAEAAGDTERVAELQKEIDTLNKKLHTE